MLSAIAITMMLLAVEVARATSFRSWLPAALCVHRHEGAWNDPNGLYYGGMQMNLAFQLHYGRWAYNRWGTADHWPVRVQLRVAYRGWKSQGWAAWPVASHTCGLR